MLMSKEKSSDGSCRSALALKQAANAGITPATNVPKHFLNFSPFWFTLDVMCTPIFYNLYLTAGR
jgi:hypothetical protein